MYGFIGYGTQPYGGIKQIPEGGRDFVISASEFIMRGANRGTSFLIARTVPRLRALMKEFGVRVSAKEKSSGRVFRKDELLRFRPKITE